MGKIHSLVKKMRRRWAIELKAILSIKDWTIYPSSIFCASKMCVCISVLSLLHKYPVSKYFWHGKCNKLIYSIIIQLLLVPIHTSIPSSATEIKCTPYVQIGNEVVRVDYLSNHAKYLSLPPPHSAFIVRNFYILLFFRINLLNAWINPIRSIIWFFSRANFFDGLSSPNTWRKKENILGINN